MNKHVVLVTGSRDWTDRETIYRALDAQYNFDQKSNLTMVLRHGACPTGADMLAEQWFLNKRINNAKGLECERYPADWTKWGKFAGPKRNREMVDRGVDVVLAFPLGSSKGTRGTMAYANEQGIPVRNYSDNG